MQKQNLKDIGVENAKKVYTFDAFSKIRKTCVCETNVLKVVSLKVSEVKCNKNVIK